MPLSRSERDLAIQFSTKDLLCFTAVVAVHLSAILWAFRSNAIGLLTIYPRWILPDRSGMLTGVFFTPLFSAVSLVFVAKTLLSRTPKPCSSFLYVAIFACGFFITESAIPKYLVCLLVSAFAILLETFSRQLSAQHFIAGLLSVGIVFANYWTILCWLLLEVA